jgi:hypothetical protein
MKVVWAVAFAVVLVGCVPEGGGGGYYASQPTVYQPAPYQPPPPSYREPQLNHLQREALADGCELRYSGNTHKLKECLNLGANWQEALAQGCQHRYSGTHEKLRECMEY